MAQTDTIRRTAALVVIDVQEGFDDPNWGERNNPKAEENIQQLLNAWRQTARPVYFVQHLSTNPHSPLHESNPGSALKNIVKPLPEEAVIPKRVHSALIGTNLHQMLTDKGCCTLVIVGLTTDHCVSTTARMAADFGFKTYVGSDATATFDRTGPDGQHYGAEHVHRIHLAALHEEFATVLDTVSIIERLA